MGLDGDWQKTLLAESAFSCLPDILSGRLRANLFHDYNLISCKQTMTVID
jgi:hypothetical protein